MICKRLAALVCSLSAWFFAGSGQANGETISEIAAAYKNFLPVISGHQKRVEIAATSVGVGGAIETAKEAECSGEIPDFRSDLNLLSNILDSDWPEWRLYESHVQNGFRAGFSEVEYEGCEFLANKSIGELGLKFLPGVAKSTHAIDMALKRFRANLVDKVAQAATEYK